MPAGCNGGRGGGGPVKNKEQCIHILSTKQTSPLANGSKLRLQRQMFEQFNIFPNNMYP